MIEALIFTMVMVMIVVIMPARTAITVIVAAVTMTVMMIAMAMTMLMIVVVFIIIVMSTTDMPWLSMRRVWRFPFRHRHHLCGKTRASMNMLPSFFRWRVIQTSTVVMATVLIMNVRLIAIIIAVIVRHFYYV